jgi:uncharacterized membrane protein
MRIPSLRDLLPALTALAITAACEPSAPPMDTGTGANPTATEPARATSTYSCDTPDGARFTVGVSLGAESVKLRFGARFDNRHVELQRDAAAPGQKYASGDGVNNDLFWVNEGRVRIDVDGSVYTCSEQPPNAVAAGASGAQAFRGVGQEPGWLLYVLPDRWIDFRYDYAERRVRTPVPEATGEGGTTRYKVATEAHELSVVIDDGECHDAMSGDAYPASVVVELDGRRFAGCGETLTADIAPGRYCYHRMTLPGADPGTGDVQLLAVEVQGLFAQGKYDWLPAEKDARRGTFDGVLDGHTVHGVYEFSQEGQRDEAPIAIRLGNDEARVSGGAPELGLAATLPAVAC